jgi:hypothetical protein
VKQPLAALNEGKEKHPRRALPRKSTQEIVLLPQNPHRHYDPPSLGVEDAIHQRAVLSFVLSHHPTRFTQGELTHILAADREVAADRNAVIGAIAELVAVGLLYRDGHFVVPTHAAIYFYRLAGRT